MNFEEHKQKIIDAMDKMEEKYGEEEQTDRSPIWIIIQSLKKELGLE